MHHKTASGARMFHPSLLELPMSRSFPSRLIRVLATIMLSGLSAGLGTVRAQAPEVAVRAAVEQYNAATTSKNLALLKSLLADDIVLYEHSVRNVGLADVWENHLRPEVEEFDNATATFTNVRITAGADMALVTREYSIRATVKGKAIEAAGNETMVWVRRNSRWVVRHIHYSHPCARPPAPAR